MSRNDIFLDSGALFAGVASATGAARALLLVAEADQITVTVSAQVVTVKAGIPIGTPGDALAWARERLAQG